MKVIICMQSFIIAILVFLLIFFQVFDFNTNMKVNNTITEFVDFSIEKIEKNQSDELLQIFKNIENELPEVLYEESYKKTLNSLKKYIEYSK
jgi:uncharacterized protein YsxB (DUF464 family)